MWSKMWRFGMCVMCVSPRRCVACMFVYQFRWQTGRKVAHKWLICSQGTLFCCVCHGIRTTCNTRHHVPFRTGLVRVPRDSFCASRNWIITLQCCRTNIFTSTSSKASASALCVCVSLGWSVMSVEQNATTEHDVLAHRLMYSWLVFSALAYSACQRPEQRRIMLCKLFTIILCSLAQRCKWTNGTQVRLGNCDIE